MTEQPGAPARWSKGDTPEVTAADAGNAVVAGQPFVEERVVGAQEVERGAVLADDALHEQLGLALEGLPQRVVEIRKYFVDRTRTRKVAQVEPLSGKVRDEVVEPRIRDH